MESVKEFSGSSKSASDHFILEVMKNLHGSSKWQTLNKTNSKLVGHRLVSDTASQYCDCVCVFDWKICYLNWKNKTNS